MRELVSWQDHVVEHPNRYKKVDNGDGTLDLVKAPGEILVQGTPMSAGNFNTMDLAALEAMLMASENNRSLRIVKSLVDGLVGDKIQVTLTNTQPYPHNNSKKSVQLPVTRNSKNYTITCEVESVAGGAVGEFVISDKLLNGFKVEYTGSASKVIVNCYVKGGI